MNLTNIQNLLNAFSKQENTEAFPFYFRINSKVFQAESVLPDIYLKTRTPFDHHHAFVKNLRHKRPKWFPSAPITLSEHVLKDYSQKTFEEFFDEKAEGPMIEVDEIENKTWVISYQDNMKKLNYGPASSAQVYAFLKSIFEKPDVDKDKKNFLVVDYFSDIYYEPLVLFELLATTFKEKAENKELSWVEREELLVSTSFRELKSIEPRRNSSKYSNKKKKAFSTKSSSTTNLSDVGTDKYQHIEN